MLDGMKCFPNRALVPGTLVLALLLSACSPPEVAEEPVVLETEDIGPADDAELDLSGDQVAKRRSRGGMGGQLPSSFPAALPVYQPSTIVDIGEGGTGGYVLFETSSAPATVQSWLRSALAGSGWSVVPEADGGLAATQGSLTVRISVSKAGPVTAIRVDY